MQAAESVIRDDFASETTEFTKHQILLQSSNAMLAWLMCSLRTFSVSSGIASDNPGLAAALKYRAAATLH